MRFLFLWGALLLFVLRVVAGACVGRWTGQPRMPPRERLHEGVGFLRRRKGAGKFRNDGGLGGLFHTLGSGQTRMPPQSDGTPPCGGAGEGLGGLGRFFHTLSSGPTIKATRNLSPPASISSPQFSPQKNGFNALRLNCRLQLRRCLNNPQHGKPTAESIMQNVSFASIPEQTFSPPVAVCFVPPNAPHNTSSDNEPKSPDNGTHPPPRRQRARPSFSELRQSALFPAPPLQIQLAATSVTDLRGAR